MVNQANLLMKDSTPWALGVNGGRLSCCESGRIVRVPLFFPLSPSLFLPFPVSPKPASWHLGLFQLNAFPRQEGAAHAVAVVSNDVFVTGHDDHMVSVWKRIPGTAEFATVHMCPEASTELGPLLLCRQAWADCRPGASQQRVSTRRSASTASTSPQTKYACGVFCALPRLAQSTYASRWSSFDHYQDILGGDLSFADIGRFSYQWGLGRPRKSVGHSVWGIKVCS